MANDVTLDEVARRSGVSAATASRALNGRIGVRDEVRERVLAVARTLDYRPNRAAKSLAGGRMSVVGLVVGSDDLLTDVYAASLVQSVVRAADRHDEGLMLILDNKEPNVAVRNLLGDAIIDGVIVSAVAIGERWVEELLDARIPTVLVGSHPRRLDVPVVDVENQESSAAVVGWLLDNGCRRVATITGRLDRVDASRRLEGWRLAHHRRQLDVNEDLVIEGDFTRLCGYKQADQLIALEPDAVFCANDEMALGLHQRLTERGVDVPGDLIIVGFDGTSANNPVGPHITSIRQPFDQLAEVAVRSLTDLVAGQTVPTEQLVAPELSMGDTTSPRFGEPRGIPIMDPPIDNSG